MIQKIELFGSTDVGMVRDHNEDNFVICKDLKTKEWSFKRDEILPLSAHGALLVVADGMGGTNAGEVASHLAQESIKSQFSDLSSVPPEAAEREKLLKGFIVKAHEAIVAHQHKNLDTAGMGTTLVLAWVIDQEVHVAWSGDSRTYIYQGQENLVPFTDDHSLVWQLVQAGQMTAEEARNHPESNIITQSLGDERSTPKPSSKSQKLYEGDRVLVCSDGLSGMMSDAHMMQILKAEGSLADLCRDLIAAANQGGGTDNITALLLEVKEGDKRPAHISQPSNPGAGTGPSKPTATQVLRKKNSSKNVVIALLLLIMAGLTGYFLLLKPKAPTIERITGKTIDFKPGKDKSINVLELLFGNLDHTVENATVTYQGKEIHNGKSPSFTFTPDTPGNTTLHITLRLANSDTYYEAEVKVAPKEKQAPLDGNIPGGALQEGGPNPGETPASGPETPTTGGNDPSGTATPPANGATEPLIEEPLPPPTDTKKEGEGEDEKGTTPGVLTPLPKEKATPKEEEKKEEEVKEGEEGGGLILYNH